VATRLLALLGALALFAALAPAAGAATPGLYTTNVDSDNVSAFSIGTNGGLTTVPGSPVSTGANSEPTAVAMTPNASVLFVANRNTDRVRGYPVGANGAIGSFLSTTTGDAPVALAANAAGNRLFVLNSGDDTVSTYSLGANPAATTELADSPAQVLVSAVAIALTPDGKFLYVIAPAADHVLGYAVGAAGSLTPIAPPPKTTGNQPQALQVTPDGRFLYVRNANSGGGISAYAIAANGTLTELAGSPFGATIGFPLVITANGTRLYAGGNGTPGPVEGFTIGGSGALTEITPGTFSTGYPISMAATNDGDAVYVHNLAPDNEVTGFSAGSSGALSQLAGSPFATGGTSAGLLGTVVSPDQGPVASIVAEVTTSDIVKLTATASTDADGTIETYDWLFGDGSKATTTSPNVQHRYADGKYTATVTVTDDHGCSTTVVYTGQSATCNGSAAATKTTNFKVDTTVLTPRLKAKSKQAVKPKAKKIVVKAEAGADENVSMTASGKIKVKGKSFALAEVEKESKAPGLLTDFKLKPAKKKQAKKVAKFLNQGKKAKAKVKVAFLDDAAHMATAKTKVTLKRKGGD